MSSADSDNTRLDEAARAGWLYYIAGHTQDEIARQLKVSRATVQRLVSLCLQSDISCENIIIRKTCEVVSS